MTKAIATLSPSLHVRDGQVFASSRDIAKLFGKTHRHVLRDIEGMRAELSAQIWAVWFRATEWEQKVGFGVRKNPAYEMTRDGFSLIAMGYTGKRAMQFKVAFIQRFNEMEAALNNPQSDGDRLARLEDTLGHR